MQPLQEYKVGASQWRSSCCMRFSEALDHSCEVLQVLSVLAPAQMQRGDTLGAQSMVSASFTLAKAIHDYPAMLSALAAVTQLHQRTGDVDSVEKNIAYTASKMELFTQQIQSAANTQQHVYIMQWQASD